jgi:hypothetical protein
MASRELGSTGLRGTLFYDKILSPTVEPDPDNAGGGKLQLTSRPSLGGFFIPQRPSFEKPAQILQLNLPGLRCCLEKSVFAGIG